MLSDKKKTPSHSVKIEVEPGWGLHLSTICPWDPSNESRPCWPYFETGEKYPVDEAVEIGCVYTDWVDEVGIESFKGPKISMELPMFAEWTNDYFEFHIGEEPGPRPT